MPSEKAETALFDIRDNIILIGQFTLSLSYQQFVSDRKTFYATTRALEIISEASRRLPAAVRERHPNLPWRAIQDAGNFDRHQYDNVVESRVWETIKQELPLLFAAVDQELTI